MTAYRFRLGTSLLLLVLVAPLSGWAQTPAASIEVPQTLEQAKAQRERAEAMKQTADENYLADKTACYQKVLVSGCLRDAKARYTATRVEARNLDTPARAFQRDVKRADIEAKEARREADAPIRASKTQQEVSDFHHQETTRASERERKIAEKAEQAAQYRQKAAAENKARQERQAERDKRDAERAAKRAREEAQADAEARVRIPKP